MPRKQKSIHYLYKTTCVITGRYYIGMHSTTNLEDGYMGSGKRLRYSIRKYGVENHVKEILEFFDSRELLVEAEKTAITTDMLCDKMCMNLKGGGEGGFNNEEHMLKCSNAGAKQHLLKLETDIEYRDNWINKKRISGKKAYADGRIKNPRGMFKGKHHSMESKRLIGKANSIKQSGVLNSQYGTMWITNGIENKKINKEDIIPEGWYKGRNYTLKK